MPGVADGRGSKSSLEIKSIHLIVRGLRSYLELKCFTEWPTLTVIIIDVSTVVEPQQPHDVATGR